jgi:stage V sporulation protein AC
MEKNKYQELVKKHTPKENRLYNGLIAFIIGGIMGVIGQFLVEFYVSYLDIPTKEASSFMIITLIFIGCLLTCFGFFDKWVNFAKSGLFVPITGFAHAMMSAALDYKKEGLVTGIGANMFKLTGSVIVFGVVSAYVFGLIRIIFFGGTI